MREILFRAKTLSHGWKEGFIGYTKDPLGTQIFWTEYKDNEPFTKKDYVLKETIGQYTGLTDKNGVKIFEGDVCKYYNSEDGDGICVIVTEGVGSYAKWIDGKISKTEIMTPLFYLQCSSEWEVIGSIHTTPELMGEREREG